MGWCSDSFSSRRCEPGRMPVPLCTNYNPTYAPCQMVPSAPIHNYALPTYQGWEQTQEETP